MPTPNSGASEYCTGAQFLEHYDARSIADLLSDSGSRLDTTAVAGSTRLQKILRRASGIVESYAFRGGMYSAADLAALTGNGSEMLQGLVADIAFCRIIRRRPDKRTEVPAQCAEAKEMLAALENGDAVFGIQEAADAGVLYTHTETADEVDNRDLATFQMSRLFGTRANQDQ